jgi:antitoxin (DNA-binding transcriptional repressor) of toxin-antitoxin stability system
MTAINVAEAKAKLSDAGEEIVIARAGTPLVRLEPVRSAPRRRKGGAWKGWTASTEVLLAQMDPEDLDAAEGKFSDEFGITLPCPKKQ